MNEKTLPKWVTETPTMTYGLFMITDNDHDHIDTTIEEYIELKRHLARMRGLLPPEETAAAEPVGRVTQQELTAFLDLYDAFYRLVYGAARRAAEYGIEPGEIDADIQPSRVEEATMAGFEGSGLTISRHDC